MRSLPPTPEFKAIAQRVVWFEEADQALADPVRFMAYALTYGVHEDTRILRSYYSDDELRDALDHAPPGIFDPRSWAYWNNILGRYPAGPLPQRTFDRTLRR